MLRGKRQRTVLIVEPHLENDAGHPILAARAFIERFNSMGWRTIVLAHKAYTGPRSIAGARVIPTFCRSYYEHRDRRRRSVQWAIDRFKTARQVVRAAGGLAHRVAQLIEPPPLVSVIRRLWFARTGSVNRIWLLLRRGLKFVVVLPISAIAAVPYLLFYAVRLAIGRPATRSTVSDFALRVMAALEREDSASVDVRILVPTATPAIVAEMLTLAALHRSPLPRVAFIFHEDPSFYCSWYRPLELDALRLRLKGSGWGEGMGFHATNARLAQKLSHVLGMPVTTVGGFFDNQFIDKLASIAGGISEGELARDEAEIISRLQGYRDAGQRLAVCMGSLRHDKGLDTLPVMLDALREDSTNFRLVLQAPATPTEARDEVLTLADYPNVEVIACTLSEHAYLRLLSISDVVLLPYDVRAYATRLSNVYLEAAMAGKPILFSQGMGSEDDTANVAASPIEDWRDWPSAAAALLHRASGTEAELGAARRKEASRSVGWHRVADWLIEPAPRFAPAKPVLFVRPSWLASGSATTFDQQLKFFADQQLPVVEVILDPDCGAGSRDACWGDILHDRARSAAQVTCWSSPHSGLWGMAQLSILVLLLMRGTYARQLAETRRFCPVPLPAKLASRRGLGMLFVNHYFHEPFAARFEGKAPLWIDTHDLQSRLMVARDARNILTGQREPFSELVADELSYLRKANVVTAVSLEEAAFFRRHLGATVMLCQPYVPNPVASGIAEATPNTTAASEVIDVLIVASQNSSNIKSLRWFVTEVLPTLRLFARRIRVVGNIAEVADREGLRAQDVEYTGAVRSLAPHYTAAKVVALPIVVGAGIAIKTLEAMAAGKPVVGTPLAFRGLPDHFVPPTPPETDPSRFAQAIARLLTDPKALHEAGIATLRAHQGLGLKERFYEQMSEALCSIEVFTNATDVLHQPDQLVIPDALWSRLEKQIRDKAPHEADFEFFHRLDPANTTFIDVGSNIGNSAVSINATCPGAGIIGFEANPTLRALLERTKEAVPDFTFHLFGLAASDGQAELLVPIVDGVPILGEASVSQAHFLNEHVRKRLLSYGTHGSLEFERRLASFKRLDDFYDVFARCAAAERVVMKIDVEGAELSVLQGAASFIEQIKPILLIEGGHRAEIVSYLKPLGYRRYLFGEARKLRPAGADDQDLNSFFFHSEVHDALLKRECSLAGA